MRAKSLLTEAKQIETAVTLINLGARLQGLESETDLSYERLLRLYKEVSGKSPSTTGAGSEGAMTRVWILRRGTSDWASTSGGREATVSLMRCSRSMSTARLSRKIDDSAWPAICASVG